MSMSRFRLKGQKLRLTENDIERQVIDLLRWRGYYVIRQHVGLFKTPDGRCVQIGEAGLPDYAVIHSRHPGFLLEVKRPGGRTSPTQDRMLERLQIGYRLAVVVVSDVKVLSAWLDRHEKGSK